MIPLFTVAEAAREIRSGNLSPVELLDGCLDRIRRFDDRVHAWVLVDEEAARRTARQRADELARGQDRGPLHGIPIGIKDIIDVEGLPTEAGSPLRRGRVAASDAPLVAALRRAGAVILGKTVTVEFACFDPSPTRNPWDPRLLRSPGGSSSGSAAAVALGMCPAAIGTQTGGSLVRPSSYCGIATVKPTFGRVDKQGIVPVSYHLDHPGPMARCVADLEVLLAVLPRSDDFGPPLPEVPRSPDGDPARPPRLGLLQTFFMDEADEQVRQATETAVEKLREAGATVEPVTTGVDFLELQDMHTRIMAAEAADYHRPDFPARRESYGPMIAGLLDEGLATSAIDYAAALSHQRDFRRQVAPLLADYDALIMPATDTTAPPTCDTTGPKRFQAPWSYAGVPVVSLPAGLAADGMPTAVQLTAPYHADVALLRVARWCERQFDFHHRPPLLGKQQ